MEEKEARRILETYADMILRISYSYLRQTYDAGKIMKASFRFKSAGIVAAACVMLIGVTAFAGSGIVSRIESHNRIGSEITAYEDMTKLEKTISMDVLTVEKFSNGFPFQNVQGCRRTFDNCACTYRYSEPDKYPCDISAFKKT